METYANIEGKGENANDRKISPVLTIFSTLSKTEIII